jgi:CubicO group peptidase (beta-lactamase class C family)
MEPAFLPPEAFPLSDPAKAEIKLGQLLAMTAGIRGNSPGMVRGRPVRIDPPGPEGWLAMVDPMALGKRAGAENTITLWTRPGGGYSYATASVHLASIILRHVTGQELEAFVGEHLAQPMGWGRWGYGYKNERPPLAHTPGGGANALRATDMLRFGHLLLRRGRWGATQLVPSHYVEGATTRSPFNPHYPASLPFEVNFDGRVAGVPRDAFWMSGSGGHSIYVVPSLDLVVYKLGGRGDQYHHRQTGLPPLPKTVFQYDGSREQWKPSVDGEVAIRHTLARVVAAIVRE